MYYQLINILFLDVNQATIAEKMYNLSFLQFFERIPEFRFEFIGS